MGRSPGQVTRIRVTQPRVSDKPDTSPVVGDGTVTAEETAGWGIDSDGPSGLCLACPSFLGLRFACPRLRPVAFSILPNVIFADP